MVSMPTAAQSMAYLGISSAVAETVLPGCHWTENEADPVPGASAAVFSVAAGEAALSPQPAVSSRSSPQIIVCGQIEMNFFLQIVYPDILNLL
jgi:hypothetical protein